MKTLKKTLCMVLAVVMVLGLFTVGSMAATSLTTNFSDSSAITYKEAVDVLNGIGVIDGMGDGTFNPKGTLTREQAAKIITYLILGKAQAESLRANSAPFNDVAADRWSAGFVSFCASEKIIAGVGEEKFDPEGTLTGYQWAKMLLVALGYDPDIEGFTGDQWAINVAKKGLAAGIFNDNLEGNYIAPATREEACLYAFNTIKADMVEYATKGTQIIVGDAAVTTGAAAATKVPWNVYDGQIDGVAGDLICQFGEQYWTRLVKNTGAATAFGDPSNRWTYKGENIGTYAESAEATIVVSATNSVGKRTLQYWLDEANTNMQNLNGTEFVWVNGFNTGANAAAFDAAGAAASNLRRGDIITFYDANEDNIIDRIIVKKYYGTKIDDVDSNVNSTDSKNGISNYVYIDGNGIKYMPGTDNNAFKVPGYNASTYVKDEILAVAFQFTAVATAGTRILDSYVATKNEGVVSAYKAGDLITIGGTTYNYNLSTNATALGFTDNYIVNDYTGTYAAYTDKNGYAVYVDVVEEGKTAADALYVVSTYTINKADDYGVAYNYFRVQVVNMQGELQNLEIGRTNTVTGQKKGHDFTDAGYTVAALSNNLVTSTYKTKDAYYELRLYNPTDPLYATNLINNVPAAGMNIKGDATRLDGGVAATSGPVIAAYRINSDTKFIIVEGTGGAAKVTTKTGAANVAMAAGDDYSVISNKSGGNYIAQYVVLSVAALNTTTYDDLLYYKNGSPAIVDKGYQYTMYKSDGTSGAFKTNAVNLNTAADQWSFYEYTVNSDGVYEVTKIDKTVAADNKTIGFVGPTDWKTTKTSGVFYDVTFAETYNGTASFVVGGANYADLPASGAAIVDLHQTSQDDYTPLVAARPTTYAGTIKSLDKMGDITGNGFVITASLYVKDNGIATIVITDISK